MIKAVFFDLDDTLFNFDERNRVANRAVAEEAERRFGISPKAFLEAYDRSVDRLLEHMHCDRWIGPVHSRILRFQNTMEQLGQPLFPHVTDFYQLYWDTVLKDMVEEPGIRQVLELLNEKKIPVGIGTNMTGLSQYRKLERMGLAKYIRYFVSSDETIVDKPDPGFFQICIEKSGVQRAECLFIGDNFEFDYLGAKKAGLQALWYNPHFKLGHEDVEEVIHSHFELLDMIHRW